MGSKSSKETDEDKTTSTLLDPWPYKFIDTSKINSTAEPKMFKKFSRKVDDMEPPDLTSTTSPLVFLHDENCLLAGGVHFNLDGSGVQKLVNKELFCHNGLALFHYCSGRIITLAKYGIRDIFTCKNIFATLAYYGHSYLEIWQCDNPFNFINFVSGEVNISRIDILKQGSIVSHATCCSISPNGKYVVLAVSSNFFTIRDKCHLEVYTFLKNKLTRKHVSFRNNMFKQVEFISSLGFSSDSKILAVGCKLLDGSGKVFLSSMVKRQMIVDLEDDVYWSGPMWIAFNPSFTNQLVTVTSDGFIRLWSTQSFNDGIILPSSSVKNSLVMNDVAGIHVNSQPKFSPDGSMLAMTISDGRIVIFDIFSVEVLWTIRLPHFHRSTNYLRTPTSLCFSKSCEYLAIGNMANFASLWLLPRCHFSLKHFCRTKIISNCPPKAVCQLPIPESLKRYLLYKS